MTSVANAFIAEGGSRLSGIITKKKIIVLTTTANTGIYKLGEI